jgi:hypothetical protein
MTKRTKIAVRILQGLCASGKPTASGSLEDHIQTAFRMADFVLEEEAKSHARPAPKERILTAPGGPPIIPAKPSDFAAIVDAPKQKCLAPFCETLLPERFSYCADHARITCTRCNKIGYPIKESDYLDDTEWFMNANHGHFHHHPVSKTSPWAPCLLIPSRKGTCAQCGSWKEMAFDDGTPLCIDCRDANLLLELTQTKRLPK